MRLAIIALFRGQHVARGYRSEYPGDEAEQPLTVMSDEIVLTGECFIFTCESWRYGDAGRRCRCADWVEATVVPYHAFSCGARHRAPHDLAGSGCGCAGGFTTSGRLPPALRLGRK
ncbi:hypothetical protein DJICPGNB_08930 [Escherichia coli]|nr:hypothetical protein DJICPGNB_08930 [Escherichia coli]